MREMLRCSVKLGCVTMAMAGVIGHAGVPLSTYSQMAQEKLDAPLLLIKIPPVSINLSQPVAGNRQNLRMDCDKIAQAQRGLKEARRSGAQLIPVAPVAESTAVPPTLDEVYHISRNEERFAGFAQQFQCGRR